jgi:hypothetical protein
MKIYIVSMDIITRKEARNQGLIKYFTGELCIKGHNSGRYVKSKECIECARIKSFARSQNHIGYHRVKGQPLEFIKQRIQINKYTQCWEWIGSLKDGYGILEKRGWGEKFAHRFVYQIYKGSIPVGLVVRHLCHNRRCVNPDHLTTGTNLDNINDYYEKNEKILKNIEGIDFNIVANILDKAVIDLMKFLHIDKQSAVFLIRCYQLSQTQSNNFGMHKYDDIIMEPLL